MKRVKTICAALVVLFFIPVISFPHCEIPCGIYNDPLRITSLNEHITTIEKSMNQIEQLSDEKPVNYNQLVRWITNKEEHATEFQHIVSQYFLTQRIKPAAEKDKKAYSKYLHELTLLHQMLVFSMKTKQTTDLAHVETLRSLVKEFKKSYFEGKEQAGHSHSH